MQLILLAAGRGTRLQKKYRNKPKCLAKVNNKAIINYNLDFFDLFKTKYIVTGYKSYHLKNFAKKNNFKIIHNSRYRSTNMTYSLFLAKKYVKDDIVVCYGDIIFNKNIYSLLKNKKNLVPLNINWLNLWKKRMLKQKIKEDAEDVVVRNNIVKSIGNKITQKLPRYQYMGILKLKKKTFFKMEKFFRTINNEKIDMTNFLNKTIQSNKIKFWSKIYKSFWFEIDSAKDIKVASKNLNKIW
jgi:choline kinase